MVFVGFFRQKKFLSVCKIAQATRTTQTKKGKRYKSTYTAITLLLASSRTLRAVRQFIVPSNSSVILNNFRPKGNYLRIIAWKGPPRMFQKLQQTFEQSPRSPP